MLQLLLYYDRTEGPMMKLNSTYLAEVFSANHNVGRYSARLSAALTTFIAVLLPTVTFSSSHMIEPAIADARANLADLFVFDAPEDTMGAGATVMVITLNSSESPHAVAESDLLPDAEYRFSIDLDGDSEADRTLSVVSSESGWAVMRGDAVMARTPQAGGTLALGADGRAWVGRVRAPFSASVPGLNAFLTSVPDGLSVMPDGINTFADAEATAIVIEVPNGELGGDGQPIGVWATVHVPVRDEDGSRTSSQASLAGAPFASFFASSPDAFNTSTPGTDAVYTRADAAAKIADMSRAAGMRSGVDAYADATAAAFFAPYSIRYTVGTPASYSLAGMNGRALDDHAFEVVLSRTSNRAVTNGVPPTASSTTWPYVLVTGD